MKQETLEEAIEKYSKYNLTNEALEFAKTICYAFKETKQDDLVEEAILTGIQWQQERSYSEEEVLNILNKFETFKKENKIFCSISTKGIIFEKNKWFEQFKKK